MSSADQLGTFVWAHRIRIKAKLPDFSRSSRLLGSYIAKIGKIAREAHNGVAAIADITATVDRPYMPSGLCLAELEQIEHTGIASSLDKLYWTLRGFLFSPENALGFA